MSGVSLEYLQKNLKLAASRTIIPFASGHAPSVACGSDGKSTYAAPLGYAFSSPSYTVQIAADGTFDLSKYDNREFAFSAPFDCILENIYVTSSIWGSVNIANGTTVYPYIMVYRAPASSLKFSPVWESKTKPSIALTGSVRSDGVFPGSVDDIGTELSAGDRLIIAGHLESSGTGSLAYTIFTYFTGGMSIINKP